MTKQSDWSQPKLVTCRNINTTSRYVLFVPSPSYVDRLYKTAKSPGRRAKGILIGSIGPFKKAAWCKDY